MQIEKTCLLNAVESANPNFVIGGCPHLAISSNGAQKYTLSTEVDSRLRGNDKSLLADIFIYK